MYAEKRKSKLIFLIKTSMNLFKKTLILVGGLLMLIGCSKEEATNETQFNNFKTKSNTSIIDDPVFTDYLVAAYDHFELKNDPATIESYIADGDIDAKESLDIHIAFGYSSRAGLDAYELAQTNRMIYLDKTYGLGSMPQQERVKLTLQGFDKVNLPFLDFDNDQSSLTICERKFRNCKRKANSIAVAMHMGCVALDVTTIPGLICHGAALIYQAAALDDCKIDFIECK